MRKVGIAPTYPSWRDGVLLTKLPTRILPRRIELRKSPYQEESLPLTYGRDTPRRYRPVAYSLSRNYASFTQWVFRGHGESCTPDLRITGAVHELTCASYPHAPIRTRTETLPGLQPGALPIVPWVQKFPHYGKVSSRKKFGCLH